MNQLIAPSPPKLRDFTKRNQIAHLSWRLWSDEDSEGFRELEEFTSLQEVLDRLSIDQVRSGLEDTSTLTGRLEPMLRESGCDFTFDVEGRKVYPSSWPA